jgi:hypothetical protein
MSAPIRVTSAKIRSRELARWRRQGRELAHADTGHQFAIGDWLLAGEAKLGRKVYVEARDIFRGFEKSALKDYYTVARRVSTTVRTVDLSFAHHRLVASFTPPTYQKELLAIAVQNKLPLSKFRALIEVRHPSRKPAKSKSVSVQVTDEQFEFLKMWAKHCGAATEGEMAQRIIADWINKYGTGEVGEKFVGDQE